MNQQQAKNWWNRNWKWFLLVISLVIFAIFIVLNIFSFLKYSDAYNGAVAKAKVHPSVQKTIGTPIKEGIWVSGNIKVNGPSGQANLAIPISGPNGEGTIYVIASKAAGQWAFSTLVLEIKETKQRIDLLEQKSDSSKIIGKTEGNSTKVVSNLKQLSEKETIMPFFKLSEPPKVIKTVNPEYPMSAKMTGIEGIVLVKALVDTKGYVEQIEIMKSVALLDDAAITAAKQFKFSPGKFENRYVKVWVSIPFNFKLKK